MKESKASPSRSRSAAYSAPALEKAIEIIELLASAPAGLPIAEIAVRMHRSMSEVFRIIVVMEKHGWLQKDPETSRYSVTYRMLELALRATPARSLTTVAAPIMGRVSEATNMSCHLVVRLGGRGLIVQREEHTGLPSGFALRPGAHVDLVRACSGHVLLAFADPHSWPSIERALPRPLAIPKPKLQKRLALVRKRGYELMPSIRTAGITDISFPVFTFDGNVSAALTVPWLKLIDGSQLTTLDETRAVLGEAARKMSLALGWTPVS